MNKKALLKKAVCCLSALVLVMGIGSPTLAKNRDCVIKNGKLIKYSGNEETFTVPDNVKKIGTGAFKKAYELKKIVIGKNVDECEMNSVTSAKKLEKIEVSKDNKKFSSYKGALYSKNGKNFYACPNNMKKLRISDKCEW